MYGIPTIAFQTLYDFNTFWRGLEAFLTGAGVGRAKFIQDSTSTVFGVVHGTRESLDPLVLEFIVGCVVLHVLRHSYRIFSLVVYSI